MGSPIGNKNHYIHGLSHTRIDNIYKSMISRCYNANSCNFKNYGAKGIKVCDEWENDRRRFYEWAFNNGYKDDLTIDRIDCFGDYEPSNCRWVSQKVQQNNRTNTIRITYQGETRTISEWSDITGIKHKTIWSRYRRGISPDRVFKVVV